jgi:hypothetical protein
MKRFVLGLINGKRDARAIGLYVSAQAVCAVVLGAHVRRLSASRFGQGGACEIDNFDTLPMFSKLIVWSAGRATKSKTGVVADDSAHAERARSLAASVAPSQHEVQQLLRLAREEAGRIVNQRWPIVVRLAAAVAQRGHLESAEVVRIVLQPARPAKARRPRPGRHAVARSRKRQPRASLLSMIRTRCAAMLSAVTARARLKASSALSATASSDLHEAPAQSSGTPPLSVMTASRH